MYKLDTSSETPLYIQIVDQTKEAIASDYFMEGDKMPSIRQMSKDLLVNQSTVSKAYKELEVQGFIKTVPGKGTFISLDEKRIELERDNLKERIKEIYKESIIYGLTKAEMEAIYDEISKEVE